MERRLWWLAWSVAAGLAIALLALLALLALVWATWKQPPPAVIVQLLPPSGESRDLLREQFCWVTDESFSLGRRDSCDPGRRKCEWASAFHRHDKKEETLTDYLGRTTSVDVMSLTIYGGHDATPVRPASASIDSNFDLAFQRAVEVSAALKQDPRLLVPHVLVAGSATPDVCAPASGAPGSSNEARRRPVIVTQGWRRIR